MDDTTDQLAAPLGLVLEEPVPARPRRGRRTQAERVAESDQRMLEAAVRLIAQHGSTQTTLETVGVAAGYSRGLAQHRFGSKDGLLEAVLAHVVKEYRLRLLPRLKGLSGLDALECEIDAYLHGMDDPPVNSRAFFMLMLDSIGPVPQIRHVFADLSERWHRHLTRQVRAGQARGEIGAQINPEAEVRLLIATVRGLRMESMLGRQTGDLATIIETLKNDIRQRLRA